MSWVDQGGFGEDAGLESNLEVWVEIGKMYEECLG